MRRIRGAEHGPVRELKIKHAASAADIIGNGSKCRRLPAAVRPFLNRVVRHNAAGLGGSSIRNQLCAATDAQAVRAAIGAKRANHGSRTDSDTRIVHYHAAKGVINRVVMIT